MSEHIQPHRWADLWAGKVDDVERAEMERHAKQCRACTRVRQRVTRASDSFATIRDQQSPDVAWDAVRAKVHWSVSTERRSAQRRQRRPSYGWLAGAIASGVVVGLLGRVEMMPADRAPTIATTAPVTPRLPEPAPVAPAGLIGLVSRASGDVMVDGTRPSDLFSKKLARGNLIATGDGRVDIQFGDKSALALGPNSTLELRRFDADTIELSVDGTLDVVVAPRAGGQKFLVEAGEHTVEVRGTQFRVVHDSGRDAGHAKATSVACRHGLVTVRDRGGSGGNKVEVGEKKKLRLLAHQGGAVSADAITALSSDELAALVQATPLTLPLWDPAALEKGSAPLEIAAGTRLDVRVDGIELGLAPLKVRVMPGRHTVEAATAGRFRRVGWVDVAAGPHGARLEVPAAADSSGGTAERKRQFLAHVDHPRLGRCMRTIAKAGLTGTYVELEIAVDPQGAIGYLNVTDTDLPSATSSCVREVLADIHFAPGPAATWREKIDL